MIATNLLAKVLADWKKRIATPHAIIPRELPVKALRPELATLIVGPRRAGKSTYLGLLPKYLGLPLNQCWFCNFEDPELVFHLGTELLDAIVEFAQERTHPSSTAYFFFDEIQSVPHWEKWIHKALTGVQDCVYVLTGSNASMLSGELATALTGRRRVYELFPFNWSEFVKACEKSTLEKYLQLGGFPVAVTDTDPMGYLKELFRDIVLRDIAPRVRVRSPKGLLQVISAVYQSVGAELSLRRIANSAGVSTDTVSQYLEACEQAYLVFSCPFFSYSQRQSSHRQQKYYAVDTGLRLAVSSTTGRDLGKSLENLVFLTLRRRGLSPAYWRNRGEVDFVISVNNKLIPIQVTWEGVVDRHYQALDEFYTQYPFAEEAVLIDSSNAVAFAQNCDQFLDDF